MKIPVAARSKAWVCDRSLPGITGSNTAGGMAICPLYCVLLGRGLCVRPITRPEESYRLWCVSECDREASIMRRPRPTGGCCAIKNNKLNFFGVLNSSILIAFFFSWHSRVGMCPPVPRSRNCTISNKPVYDNTVACSGSKTIKKNTARSLRKIRV
jgi:hypothetical protein